MNSHYLATKILEVVVEEEELKMLLLKMKGGRGTTCALTRFGALCMKRL